MLESKILKDLKFSIENKNTTMIKNIYYQV